MIDQLGLACWFLFDACSDRALAALERYLPITK